MDRASSTRVHSIAADAQGNIYVADRNNRRIQVFDSDGKFQREIRIDMPPPADAQAAIGNKPDLTNYLTNRRHHDARRAVGALHHAAAEPGALQLGRVPGPHLQARARRQGARHARRSGKQLKQFGWIHEIACPSENTLYVAEILNWRVQKLILHPASAKSAGQ